MITFIKRFKIILLLLLLLVAAAVIYGQFFYGTESDFLLLSQDRTQISGSTVGREIIGQIDELQALNLDSSFFDDPVFRSLNDYEREVQSESVGRSNPFAPLGF